MPDEPKEKTEQKPEGEKETADKVREEAEKLKKENDELSKQLKRREELRAQDKLSGTSEAGEVPQPPKKLSDKEYAEQVQRGEVNPLKDDGFG